MFINSEQYSVLEVKIQEFIYILLNFYQFLLVSIPYSSDLAAFLFAFRKMNSAKILDMNYSTDLFRLLILINLS